MMKFEIENKVALITGASRGIGAKIADTLAQAGATVVGTATSASGAAAIQERLSDYGKDHRGCVLDVNQADHISQVLKQIAADLSAPLIVVNNAGITRDQILMRMQEGDWDAVLETNLRSVFRISKAALRPMMKARWGRIINISSVIAALGNPGQANYAAAKAGMIGFSKSLAREIGSRGITVNVVAPGFIDTDMTQALSEEQREVLLKDIPLQRLGDPADIANAVLYLSSDAAGYITGQTLHVNGGMYMN